MASNPDPRSPGPSPAQSGASDYIRALDESMRVAREGGPIQIPPPRTPAEFMALLGQIRQSTLDLGGKIQALLEVNPAQHPTVYLAGLSLEDKLELGRKQCEQLTAIAYQYAPEQTLDLLESEIEDDLDAKEKGQAVVEKAAQRKPPSPSRPF